VDPRLILEFKCNLLLAFEELDLLLFNSTQFSFEFLQLHHFIEMAMLVDFLIFFSANSLELNGFFGGSVVELFL